VCFWHFVIPPYCSMGILSLLCVFWFFFVCTVTDFSAAEKDSGLKLCMRVRLLSGMSFSHFGELWLPGSHGGGITSGMSYIHLPCTRALQFAPGSSVQQGSVYIRNWGRRRIVRPYGGICVLQACWRTCFHVVCRCCVRFRFFSTEPRDWLGRTSRYWSILCHVGRNTLTQSINQSVVSASVKL